jgi:hypothetical protein
MGNSSVFGQHGQRILPDYRQKLMDNNALHLKWIYLFGFIMVLLLAGAIQTVNGL